MRKLEAVERLIEMPWLKVHGKDFDLELENFTSNTDFIEFLSEIFSGKQVTDKFGNVLQLRGLSDKQNFIDSLYDNSLFKILLKSKFTDNERRLIEIISSMD